MEFRHLWTAHRRLAILGFVVVVLLVTLGMAHTPFVRARALAWVVGRVQADAGIRAESDGLDYNLFTLRAALGHTTLTAGDHAAPFLSFDGISVDLPWSIITGRIAVESLEIERPTISIVRDLDGRLNLPELPESTDPNPAPIGPIEVGHLAVRDLRIGYIDQPMELSIDGRGVTLDMPPSARAPLAGRFSVSDGVTIKLADRETSVSRLDGGLSFDGSVLAFDELTLEAPELHVRLDGHVDLLSEAPRVDARYAGRLVLERLAPWVVPDQALSGAVDFSGTVAGALDAPRLTLAASGKELAWRDQRGMMFDLETDATPAAATVERVRLALGGGSIEGRARIGLAEGEASSVDLTWTRLDLGSIARTAGVEQVRVAAVAEGRASAAWTGADPLTGTANLATALSEGRAPSGALPLAGRLSAALEDGRWTATLDGLATREVRLDGEATGRLDSADMAATTVGGHVRANVGDLSALLDELRRAGLDVPAESPLSRGRASVDAELSGTVGSPSAAGTLEADDLEMSGVGPGLLTAAFDASPARVSVRSFRFVLGPDTANGDLDVDLTERTLLGAFAADLPRLSLLAAPFLPEWQPEGAATFKAEIGGTIENPRVRLTADATGLEVAGQRIEHLDLAAQLANQVLSVERLDLTQAGGQLGMTGRYHLDGGRYSIEGTGRGLAVRPLVMGGETQPIEARFDLDVSGEGTIDAPQGRATINVRDLTWDTYALGAARLEATVADQGLRLSGAAPALDATLNARVSINAPRLFTADMAVSRAELTSLIRPVGPAGVAPAGEAADAPFPLTGAITLTAKASGDLDLPQEAAVDVNLGLIDVTVGGAAILLERPARVRYDAGRIVAEDVSLRVGDTVLTALGQLGDAADRTGLTVSLKGGLADFLPFARLAPGLEAVDFAGSLDFAMHASGALDAPRVDATLAIAGGSASMPDVPAATDVRLRATLNEGLLTLSEIGAAWQGATLKGSGTVPATILGDRLPEAFASTLPPLPDRARVELRLDSVTAAMAAPFVDEATLGQLSANLDAAVVIEATSMELEGVVADLTLDRAELALAGEPLRQDRPTKLRLADGRLTVVDWTWSGGANRLTVSGGATLAGESPALKATLAGSLDLRMLGAFSPDLAAGGRADFDFRATGPLGEPVIEGELALHDGELAIRDPRIAITDLRGTVRMTADRLSLVDVQAAANGGTLQLSGDVELKAFQPTGGSIGIQGRGLALEVPENLRSEVNLDLTFAVSEESPALTGTVTVLRGSYREPISLAGQLLSGVEVVPAVQAEPSLLDRVRLSINVVSEEGLIVDNNYGRLEIGADLKVAGTPSQPALAGRLTISEGGAVFLAGQTWTLERGTVDFTSATTIEPNVDLVLATRVQYYDIRLSVGGTPETMEATLTSPEGLSQADAVSLLLTGKLAEESTMTQTTIARGQLLLLLSGELLGFAGRAVGLDSAQVSRGLGGAASDFDLLASDTDPSARLTIAKQLRRDVELVFSQSLRDSNDLTWIASYRPVRAIELRTSTRDDNTRTYEFRNELNLGGRNPMSGGRNVGVTSGRAGSSLRVSAVHFTGATGFDERELRNRVKLDQGDRFDFYRWQQDRDRLANLYRDRGFFEARIRATRDTVVADAGDSSIALTYAVERGPATSLVVEGASLPGDALEAMEETWVRAVFDGFLQEDLERLAKQSLAEDGYLQAAAETEIREDEGATKQIVLRLTPGTRYTDRRLVFEGQERLSADELEAVVRARQLMLAAWLRPADVEAALVSQYRALGYQSARVSIGAPVFANSTATLPVTVIEGPEFQVAGVEIEGVSLRPVDEVRKAFGVEPGTPYVPSALEPARRAVEVGYLRDGYNDVRVSVTSVADPETPSAHITLSVQEGRQQVLESVSVTGAAMTTAGTVSRALDLEVGKPIDLSDIYRAQKRLYDTGVFQRADVDLQPTGEPGTDSQEPVRAAVSLEEIRPYRLRYGVRLTDETGPVDANREFRPGFVTDFLRRNLFGRAVSAGVAGQIESDRQLVRGIVSTPQFFGLPVTSNLFLTRSRQDFTPEGFNPFIEEASEVTAEQRFRPRSTMVMSYDYRFKRSRVFEPGASGVSALDVPQKVARLTGTFAWDTRDDPFNARRGWLNSSGIEYAAASLGSDLRFIKYILQQFYFRPVGQRVVLASAFRLGAARGLGGQVLLPTERFFVGGGTSVRGFAEDGLGDVDFFGPAGGAASLILNQEVRFPIYKWVAGVGFFDAGNVFERTSDLSVLDLEVGSGFGVRVDTPFGLARIDFGMPLTRRSREPIGRWYFSLGQTF